MEIVVCVRPVPETETRLRARADGRTFETDGVKFVLAGYDESAVEQALLLKETVPGSRVHAVSAGPAPRTEEVLRACLALGADLATGIDAPTDLLDDPVAVGGALAAALRGIPHDLVLCGKQAGDHEEGIVPAVLAERLGVPDFGAVTDLRYDAAGPRVRFRRATEQGVESWESPLPVVVGLQQAWNDPRTAKLPAILKSRKATITKLGVPADLRSSIVPLRFELPAPRTGAKLIEYATPEEAAAKLVRLLREEAKVFP